MEEVVEWDGVYELEISVDVLAHYDLLAPKIPSTCQCCLIHRSQRQYLSIVSDTDVSGLAMVSLAVVDVLCAALLLSSDRVKAVESSTDFVMLGRCTSRDLYCRTERE